MYVPSLPMPAPPSIHDEPPISPNVYSKQKPALAQIDVKAEKWDSVFTDAVPRERSPTRHYEELVPDSSQETHFAFGSSEKSTLRDSEKSNAVALVSSVLQSSSQAHVQISLERPSGLNSDKARTVTKASTKKEPRKKGAFDKLKDTKDSIGCKNVCGKWIVGADLLFEKVRSQPYAVVSLSASVLHWVTVVVIVPRKHITNMFSWFHYYDCAGSESAEQTSFFGLGSLCDLTPSSGPVWELITNILWLTFFLSLTCMANNPYRSKAWCFPAFVVSYQNAMAQVTIFVYVLNGTNVLPSFFDDDQLRRFREDSFPETAKEDAGYGDWSLGFLWYMTISLVLLTLLEFALLFSVMCKGHENDHYRRMFKTYSAHVNDLLTHKKSEANRSQRFQDISDALAGVCDKEKKPIIASHRIPACAAAVIMRIATSDDHDSAQTVESRWSRCKALLASFRIWLFAAFHLGAFGQSEGDGAPPDLDFSSQRAEGKRKRQGCVFHLPVLVWFAAVFSVWFIGLTAVELISIVTGIHQRIVPAAQSAREWSTIGVETLEGANVYLKQVHGVLQELAIYNEQLLQVQKDLRELEETLAPVPALLQPVAPDGAAQVEEGLDVIRFVQTLTSPAAAVFGEELNTTELLEWADQVSFMMDHGTYAARNLSDVVDHTSREIETFTESIVLTGFISVPTSFVIILICIVAMLRSWLRCRQEIALGKKEADTEFIKKNYHPVRAPQLPGLMSSSALFGFLLLNLMFFVIIQVAYWLPQAIASDIDGFLEFAQNLLLTVGSSLAIKSLILDQTLGRRILVSGEGFVLRWQAFTWYIVFMIPLSLTSGAILALIRFISLLVICSGYVVRLDTTLFPNDLQAFDAGYVAFMSSVLLDHRHRNPIWTCLLEKLQLMHLKVMKDDSKRKELLEDLDEDMVAQQSRIRPSTVSSPTIKRVSRKWQLARTLVNNPQLINERRHSQTDEG